MHEVVHLSLGPQANHLNGQFYDCQSTYFVFSDEEVAKSLVDPSVRFVAGKEYTPRAVFWDFRGGFGNRLRFSAAYEPQTNTEQLTKDIDRLQVLDQTQVRHADLYWAAGLRVPLHPKQQFELPDWEFDPVDFRFGKPRGADDSQSSNTFLTYGQGVDQFEALEAAYQHEYLDSTVRRVFEQCDNLSGINAATDFSGWGGFSVCLLEQLRDDFAQKVPVFSWAASFHRSLKKAPRVIIDSYLETMLGLSEFSDLVVPMALDTDASFAENAAKANTLFETVAVMSSLRQKRLSMATIAEDLTIGANANIVCGSSSVADLIHEGLQGNKVESRVGFLRATSAPIPKTEETALLDKHLQTQKLVDNGTYPHRLHKHVVPQRVSPLMAPEITENYLYADLALTDGVKSLEHLVGINHDLKVRTLDLVENYRWGYESDSDELE